jgi:class 3 adenylate cyclase
VIVCPSCSAENPDTARFCHACGAALEAPAAPVREERKVVTVLFADLVGFTARAEQLDPEDVRGLLAPYHAHLQRAAVAAGDVAHRLADRERGAHRPLGVVLVRQRGAEERHHGVADELLDRAPVALELGADTCPVRSLEGAHLFRIELLGAGGEADQVGEQDGQDLALLAGRRGFGGERRGAACAEASVVRVLPSAGGADNHAVAASIASPSSTYRLAPTER